MPIVGTPHHLEHGKEDPFFTNVLTNSFPVSEGVSATDAIGGGYSHRVVMNSNDSYELNQGGIFTRASGITPILFHFAFGVDDLSKFDHLSFYLKCAGSASASYIGVDVQETGAVVVRCGSSNAASFSGNTSIGVAAPAGTIVGGLVRNVISIRAVIDNSSGEIQMAANGTEYVNETGLDTFKAFSGAVANGWGPGLHISTVSSGASNQVIVFDDFVFAEDEAEPLAPIAHTVQAFNGVTANNDGTVTGGASDAADAIDEIPGDNTQTFTLDTNGDIQGLTVTDFDATGISEIYYVEVLAEMGDSADGSETVRVNVDDGTTQANGTSYGMTSDFSPRSIYFDEDSPTGGGWDDTKLDALEVEFERTA